jgi:L-threonylcarbamoyladenylate synthase
MKQEIEKAIAILKSGGVVVFPTDTAYGLAVDATNFSAVRKLYALKGRDFRKPIHIIFPSVEWLAANVVLDKKSLKLMNKFLPGPLTVIAKLKSKNKALNKIKGSTGIGLRFPKDQIALKLAQDLAKPITATSANISGSANTYSITEVKKQFAKSKYKPDFYLDSGRLKKVKPSTIVSVVGNNARILREGPISETEIKRALK